MPTFVVRLTHTPETCPAASGSVREHLDRTGPEIPAVAEKCGLRITTGPLVMTVEHESLAVVEADGVPNVHEFLVQSGLVQFNTATVSLAQQLPDALAEFGRLPSEPLF